MNDSLFSANSLGVYGTWGLWSPLECEVNAPRTKNGFMGDCFEAELLDNEATVTPIAQNEFNRKN